jgi:hypothetical protein
MALVYQGNTFVNYVMLRSGLAAYDGAGKNQRKELYKADMYARNNKVGIYSTTCTQTEPPNPACAIKGNMDTTSDNKNYFLPGCGFYSAVIIHKFEGDDWFCSEAEARKAGFVKSETCD